MSALTTTSIQPDVASSDSALAERIAAGDDRALETLMRRYNPRLYRIARAILKDDADAEDALQEAYLRAYRRIGDFRGDAQLSTWLTRIVINQALMRARQLQRRPTIVPFSSETGGAPGEADVADERIEPAPDALLRDEMRRVIERRIDELPDAFRTVFMLREVEGLTVDETAECLDIPPATVRTRFFRARALLRASLSRDLDRAALDVFSFEGGRCDRIVANVLARVRGNAGR